MGKSIVFCSIILLIGSSLQAQKLKLGFVEDQRILAKLPAVKEVQKILDQETALWEARFNERSKRVGIYLDSVTAVRAALEKAREECAKKKESPAGKMRDDSSQVLAGGDSTGKLKAQDSSAGSQVLAAGKEKAALSDTLEILAQLERLESELDKAKKELVAFYHKIYGRNGILERRNAELSQSILEKINQAIAETGERLGIALVFDSSVLQYVNQDFNFTEQVMEALGIEQEQRAR